VFVIVAVRVEATIAAKASVCRGVGESASSRPRGRGAADTSMNV
jgi:hypothetical protein